MKQSFISGADISFLDEVEQSGGQFYDLGAEDNIKLLSQHGINGVRLRIWNKPPGGYCNLDRTLKMAKRIKEFNMHFLLCFHFSDVWADPKHQSKPVEWEHLDYASLHKALQDYIVHIIQALKDQGTMPDMVQIGNEITMGILWEEGSVNGELRTLPQQWEQFTSLIKTGIDAVKSVDKTIKTMIHVDRGGDQEVCRFFYDKFEEYHVNFDTIGLSFYPWWHGTFNDLENNLADLAERYDKEMMVVEVAYPWLLDTANTLNVCKSEEQLHAGYSATPEGQARYMTDFIDLLKRTPNDKCIGFHYWEPSWLPCKDEWSVGHENNWSNLTLFDFDGQKLPALDSIKKHALEVSNDTNIATI
ncbi:glycosyl hydrolase 53 family protein [Paenibacillus amylolyticus]|nr:glycosyl hydrolase 53 family protein [Paenibacillus amylolyticus]WFR61355.1 glycosyl hydrolase 53 family protein [Paenibacillus amylolyticus]